MTQFDTEAFARAKARVERNIGEIDALSRGVQIGPEVFFGRYVALVVDSLDAMGGAVWMVEAGKPFKFTAVSFASSGYDSSLRQKDWIDRVLAHAVSEAKPCIVAVQDVASLESAEIGNEVPHPFFYLPVLMDGKVVFVLQVWLKEAGDPRSYKDITAFLEGTQQRALTYLRGLRIAELIQKERFSRGMLKLQDDLLGELNPQSACEVVANQMVDLLPCDLAAVLRLRRGDWHLVAASNQDAIDGRAAQSRALSDLAEKLPVTTDGGVWPDPAKLSQEGVEQLLSSAHFGGIAWCHVRSSARAEPNIVLLGLWHEPLADPGPARETLAWCGVRLAKAMDAATLFQNIPLRPLLAVFGRMSRAWRENRRGRVVGVVVAPVVVALAVLLYPAPFKIKADCVVFPSQLVAVVAEADARVSKVIAREGDQVAAGQVLAQQEDLEFVTQLEVSRQQLARWQVEAARAQALGQEAERKLAELSVRREEANIRRLEYLRGRTELRSPINGLVLTKGISHREGEALQKGEVFCEVGSAEAFELQLDVRQQDAGAVLDALKSGAPLSVDFLLHSHARHPLRGELSGSDSLSQLPELRANQSVFTARLPITAQVLEEKGIDLRSGYTGKASIRLGRRPLGWLLVRPFRQFWSVNWSL